MTVKVRAERAFKDISRLMEFDLERLFEDDTRLRRLARAIVHDAALADDVVQSAYASALEHSDRIRSPLHWMFGTIRRLAAQRFRAEARRLRREHAAATSAFERSPAELIEREQIRRSVFDALMALEEPLRTTLRLRFLEGLPPREVAKAESIAIEVVHARVARGLSTLRSRLAALDPNCGNRPILALIPFATGAPFQAMSATVTSQFLGGMLVSTPAKVASVLAILALTSVLVFRDRSEDATPESAAPNATAPAPSVAGGSADPVRTTIDPNEASQQRQVVASSTIDPAPEEPQTLLIVKATFDPDHAPAANLGVVLTIHDTAATHERMLRATTDLVGEASFHGVPAGLVSIASDRGGSYGVAIKPGVKNEFDLRVPAGAKYVGRVVDSKARPIVGAGIFLTEWMSGEGSIVTRTDSTGSYEIPNITSQHYLGARMEGYAPSVLRRVIGSAGARHEIDFVLPGPGGALVGIVQDALGQVVADAKVVFDPENEAARGSRIGRDDLAAVPHATYSDREGRFRFEGLPCGSFEVTAQAPGSSVARNRVVIAKESTADAILVLRTSGRIVGSLRDDEGKPVAGAVVRRIDDDGANDRSDPSSAEGEFQLLDVPPGNVDLEVVSSEHQVLHVVAVVESDRETNLDLMLTRGYAIFGRIVDDANKALEGVVVDVKADDPEIDLGRRSEIVSDSQGRFAIRGLPLTPCALEFWASDSRVFSMHRENTIVPDATERVITIRRELIPTAWIRGRVVDHVGRPVVGARVKLGLRLRKLGKIELTTGDGGFEFGPLPAGEYDVTVDCEGLLKMRLPRVTLAAGDEHDFGTVNASLGEMLAVKVNRPADLTAAEITVRVVDDKGERFAPNASELGLEFGPLGSGNFQLEIDGPEVSARSIPFTMSQSDSAIEVTIERGLARSLSTTQFVRQARAAVPFRVEGKDGNFIFERRLLRSSAAQRHECRFTLAEGEYFLILDPSAENPARRSFVVRAGDPEEISLED